MSETRQLHAWVDESHQNAGEYLNDPVYLLAATVASPEESELLRDALRALVPKGSQRIHWHEEEMPARRRQIAQDIAVHSLMHTVVVGSPLNPHKPERARRRCLELLLIEMQSQGVTQMWMESRTAADNARDAAVLAYLRTSRLVVGKFRLDFVRPLAEPILWVPDVVAGALGRSLGHGEEAPLAAFDGHVARLDVHVS